MKEVNTDIVKTGIAKEGDLFVIVCGSNHGMGENNQVKVERVLSSYWDEVGESDMSAHNVGREAQLY